MRRRPRLRFLLPFAAGAAATALLLPLGSVGTLAATRYDDLSLFTNVLDLVRKNYVEPVDEQRLVRGAIRGVLEELDPHSSFLDRDVYREMQIETKGEFAGLGIEISKSKDGFIEVVAPIEGTPAARAGIEARDRIVAICPSPPPEEWEHDCRNTKPMSLVEAVHLMRGERGTEITIRVMRQGFEQPEPYTIVRDIVKVVSVEGRLLDRGYGYVRLRAFQERTSDQLSRTLDRLGEEQGGPLQGLVVDLRDNPGGLLEQAVKVADFWLRDGLILRTKGRTSGQRQEFRAHEQGTEPAYPIVVLVNGGSASASEIVAGALQDQSRALVLGTRTFGKGSVQTIIPLDGGFGLRLTTALYYTPGDRSIQEVGIVPDIPVEAEAGAQHAGARSSIREQDLQGHLTFEEVAPEGADPGAAERGDDVQLARALEVLKSWRYFERFRDRQKAVAARETDS